MGKRNKYKELVGLASDDKILRQIDLAKKFAKISRKKSKKLKVETPTIDESTKIEKRCKRKSENLDTETETTEKPKRKRKKKTKDSIFSEIADQDDDQIEVQSTNESRKDVDLKTKMVEKLSGARFRYINEILYTSTGSEAKDLFTNDRQLFDVYHDGYRNQKQKWPFDPLDNVIQQLKRMSSKFVIADMGCGDGRLAASVKQQVHSFDLVSVNKRVVASDIANVPLEDDSVDTCIFCLSLMGTNLVDYIFEANRILKKGGIMKIVEIRSRFESIGYFRRSIERLGFQLSKHVKLPDDYFIQMDFEKVSSAKKQRPPSLTLKPCLYKKR